MKKVFVALAIINLFSLTCYSIERYTSDQLISRIERASVSFNTTRMKKAWKTLCEQDKTTCSEKKIGITNCCLTQKSVNTIYL